MAPSASWRTEGLLLVALLGFAAVIWIWGADRLDLRGSMEAMRAVGIRNMMASGDYVVPRLGAAPYLAKPPLFYWLGVLSSRWLGGEVTVMSTRLVSALSAMLALLVLHFAVRPVLGWPTAFVAALLAVMMPTVFSEATQGEVNMPLALGVAVSLFGVFYVLEGARPTWLFAVVAALGFSSAVLTKGPLGPFFLLPTLLLYVGLQQVGQTPGDGRRTAAVLGSAAALVWLGQFVNVRNGAAGALVYLVAAAMLLHFACRRGGYRRFLQWHWLVFLGLTLLLLLPWPLLVLERLGASEALTVLKRESWEKLGGQVGRSNVNPAWFYLRTFPQAILPATLFAPLAFLPGYASGRPAPERRLLLFACCWLAGSFVLFSLGSPGKAVRYLMPVFPAASLLAADVIVRGSQGRLGRRANDYVRRTGRVVVVALCFAPVACIVAWFALGLSFSGWVVVAAAVTTLGAFLGVWLQRRRVAWAPLLALPLALIGPKIVMQFGYSQVRNQRDSSRIACEQLRSHVPAGEALYLFGAHRTAIRAANAFYLGGTPLEPHLQDPTWLARQDRIWVALEKAQLASLRPPSDFQQTVVAETNAEGDELLLLRLDRSR